MLRAILLSAGLVAPSAALPQEAEPAYEVVPMSSQIWALPADSLTPRPAPRPAGIATGVERRCTPDGAHCITVEAQAKDTCTVIAAAARQAGIDAHFFARLLWRESLFDPSAVSHAGARGIAQFMPATARRRGLVDPFNPAAAIFASADYLAELTERFGNPGLAAAAYNAGERRVEDFLRKDRSLPPETRAYVPAITGFSGIDWRDDPPRKPDYALQPGTGFAEACLTMASTRRFKGFEVPITAIPTWSVVIATGRTEGYVRKIAREQRRKHRRILKKHEVEIVSIALPGKGKRKRPAAIVPRDTQRSAQKLCKQLQDAGTFCLVVSP